ncbi:MAG: UvrB/UvrC motif-containing protein [Candidatus Brocadiia bacterium]
MKCDRCSKGRASVHSIEVSDGGSVKDIHLCADCAKTVGLTGLEEGKFEDMIQHLLNEATKSAETDKNEATPSDANEKTCPDCGLTIKALRRSGKFGCEKDFHIFREAARPILLRLHGSATHKGKAALICGEASRKQQTIQALEKQLDDAIRSENYELAAELRDRIKGIS